MRMGPYDFDREFPGDGYCLGRTPEMDMYEGYSSPSSCADLPSVAALVLAIVAIITYSIFS